MEQEAFLPTDGRIANLMSAAAASYRGILLDARPRDTCKRLPVSSSSIYHGAILMCCLLSIQLLQHLSWQRFVFTER